MAINDLQERAAEDSIKQRQAELKYRTVADFTYDWEYWADFDGKLLYVSPSVNAFPAILHRNLSTPPLLSVRLSCRRT
jgi:hypothetical protein